MPPLDDYDHLALGVSAGEIQLERTAAIRDVSAALARQARREILVFGHTLESELYDCPPFLEAVRRLALARTALCVRILVSEAREAAASGHRLVELARRITSRIAILRVAEDDRARPDAFLVVDECAYLYRHLADRMEAVADFYRPMEARRLRTDFNQLWQHAAPDSELRRLHL